jgi:hypothetical protein
MIIDGLPRYGVSMVGGGWDITVVYDRSINTRCSVLNTENWVARFKDNSEGYNAAEQKAKELNALYVQGLESI